MIVRIRVVDLLINHYTLMNNMVSLAQAQKDNRNDIETSFVQDTTHNYPSGTDMVGNDQCEEGSNKSKQNKS